MDTMFRLKSSRVIVTAAFALLILFLLFGQRPFTGRAVVAQQGAVSGADKLLTSGSAGELPTDQIIVKFVEHELSQVDQARQMDRLSRAAGVQLDMVRPMSGDAVVLGLPEAMPPEEVEAISVSLEADPAILYAEPDHILRTVGQTAAGLFEPNAPAKQPDDTLYSSQWNYRYSAGSDEGINLPPAWDKTTGSLDVVVGVIDTGILDHEDLVGRTVSGYDFISSRAIANDGDSRDPDPGDPGDWEPAGFCAAGADPRSSSWHGTHVAGTIGAATNNGKGVAGINWKAKILPVRVLGRCGGYLSDVLDGALWAAGFDVPGVPQNGNPARVINLSLYGEGKCSTAQQAAFDRIVNSGTVVVVAAANNNTNVANFNPANCNKVIAVAASDRGGNRAFYSNYGSLIKISAPGGEFGFDGVLSTSNSGDTVPQRDNYAYYQGTSMAAPHVSGVVSLLIGQNPSLSPAQILDRLQDTARDFPAGSSCNPSICGAGIVDAAAALYDGPAPTPTVSPTPEGLPAPRINDIVNSDGDGNFAVVWSQVPEADTYILNQKRNNGVWRKVYEGPKTSLKRIDLVDGTYCFRARTVNSHATSAWSTVECTVVGTPTPTPTRKPMEIQFLPVLAN